MGDCFRFAAEAQHKIKIERPVEVVDAYGGRSVTWQTVSEPWAIMKPASGRELYAQGALQARVTHTAVIRYISTIKDIAALRGHRVTYDGRFFGLNYLVNLDRTLKNEGTDYQRLHLEENGPDING